MSVDAMLEGVEALRQAIAGFRFPANNEAQFQAQLEKAFSAAGLNFEREYLMPGCGGADRLDFWLPDPAGVAIEVKAKGSHTEILRQLKRYSMREAVNAVVLIARKPVELPPYLSGKPLVCLSIWRGLIA